MKYASRFPNRFTGSGAAGGLGGSLSSDAMISIFGIQGGTWSHIDDSSGKITVKVPYNTDKTALVANFLASAGASVKIGNTNQISGKTVNDFTNALSNPLVKVPTYTVTSEDGSSTKTYKVYVMETVTKAELETKRGGGAVTNDLRYLDTSGITNMRGMFHNKTSFNQDLSLWDVSSVTDMYQFFSGASAFNNGGNEAIKNWDVSNVITMTAVFQSTAFNQDISGWDVSKVTAMNFMFYGVTAFDWDISSWKDHVAENISHGHFATNAYAGFTADKRPYKSW